MIPKVLAIAESLRSSIDRTSDRVKSLPGDFPTEILVREAKVNGQVLVSTMHNARAVPKRERAALYARRAVQCMRRGAPLVAVSAQ